MKVHTANFKVKRTLCVPRSTQRWVHRSCYTLAEQTVSERMSYAKTTHVDTSATANIDHSSTNLPRHTMSQHSAARGPVTQAGLTVMSTDPSACYITSPGPQALHCTASRIAQPPLEDQSILSAGRPDKVFSPSPTFKVSRVMTLMIISRSGDFKEQVCATYDSYKRTEWGEMRAHNGAQGSRGRGQPCNPRTH